MLGALGLLVVAALAAAAFFALQGSGGSAALPVLGLLLLLTVAALWAGFVAVERHFDGLERLREALLVAAGRERARGGDRPLLDRPADRETAMLAEAVAGAVRSGGAAGARADERLSAVVGAAAEGLVVITESGLVSLVNAAARQVLGGEAAAVGTSIYAAIDRDSMARAEQAARDTGSAVEAELRLLEGATVAAVVAPLPGHDGFVISLRGRGGGHDAGVEHDLDLHDGPLAAGTGGDPDGWPLEDMPVLAIDSETTGLDPAEDRLVALGAVRAQGRRLYPRTAFDRLVQPGRPIPAESTGIHGITDAMVAAAPPFPVVFRAFEEAARGCVLVGHCVGFDLAVLRAECGRAGLAWQPPPALDTALLFAALDGVDHDPGLEALADRLGIAVEGRHTALGDALVAADLWLGALPLLRDRGVRTYGEARRLCAAVRPLVVRQRAAGWIVAAG